MKSSTEDIADELTGFNREDGPPDFYDAMSAAINKYGRKRVNKAMKFIVDIVYPKPHREAQ
jgi:hypothetical protein